VQCAGAGCGGKYICFVLYFYMIVSVACVLIADHGVDWPEMVCLDRRKLFFDLSGLIYIDPLFVPSF